MRVGIIGALGKMGREIIQYILLQNNITISSAVVKKGNTYLGMDLGMVLDNKEIGVMISSDLDEACKNSDILIDFSNEDFLKDIILAVEKYKKPLISGTTGFGDDIFLMMKNAAKNIPILWSSNMSVGINIILDIAAQIAKKTDENFKIEIIEAHHKNKKDSPSGTAISIAKSLQFKVKEIQNIGISSIRAGNIVGDHNIMFIGENEIITLSHQAQNRKIFAEGAVKAAKWLLPKEPGFYAMSDFLKLS